MGRQVHANCLARRSLPRLLHRLRFISPNQWQPQLFAARQILTAELELPEEKALSVILELVTAAQRYVMAESQRAKVIEHKISLEKARKLCRQFVNCVKNGRADVRGRLDQMIGPLICAAVIDFEVIKSVFEAAETVFTEFLAHETSGTALRCLGGLRAAPLWSLTASLRLELEKRIAELAASKKQLRAQEIFDTIASALEADQQPKVSKQAHALITGYVDEVAYIWRSAELKPTRGRDPSSSAYIGEFHRFTELVLTAMAEPGALRHDGNIKELRQAIGRIHAKLPKEVRPLVSSAPRRADIEWLVSDDHVKMALRSSSNFRSQNSVRCRTSNMRNE